MILPGTTLQVCPVDHSVNTNPKRDPVIKLSPDAFYHLKKYCMQPKGAVKAYRRSQSLTNNTAALQFIGAGEGTDNLDFLADMSTLDVIDPDAKKSMESSLEVPIPCWRA